MRLRLDEAGMLQGKHGESVRRAMEFLVRIGEANCADEMVDVTSVHLLTVTGSQGPIFEYESGIMENAQAVVRTTTHALPTDLDQLGPMGFPHDALERARETQESIRRMYEGFGALPTYTCMPNLYCDFRLGEHLAFTDSQVVPLVNSWFGAMTNMETPASAIASAITGKTPKYGMHLRENRHGEALIEVDPKLNPDAFDRADYAALAFWAGRQQVDGLPVVPVYQGLSPKMTVGDAKNMALPNTWNSGSLIFHVVGVTPEAPGVDCALGSRQPKAHCSFGEKELADAYRGLTSATDPKIDAVSLGCPHCTIEELAQIARLIEGRHVHRQARLFVGVSRMVKELGTRMGLTKTIEEAGGMLLTDCCASFAPVLNVGARVVATNAGALYMVPVLSQGRTSVWFGPTAQCIDAAINGRWEV